MKKILVLTALSLAAISCTKSEVLESSVLEQPINFKTYLGKAPVSKATIQTANTMELIGFDVKALKTVATYTESTSTGDDGQTSTVKSLSALSTFEDTPYMDVKLSKKESESNWSYVDNVDDQARSYYWPTNLNDKLVFVSYGLNGASAGSYTENDQTKSYFTEVDNTSFTYKVPREIASQQDLLAANTSILDQETCTGSVSLTFSHLLSRINFGIKSNSDDNLKVYINDLKLTGKFRESMKVTLAQIGADGKSIQGVTVEEVEGDGQANINYQIINDKAENEPKGQEYTLTTETQDMYESTLSGTGSNQYMMIIPQSLSDIKIEGSYTVDDDPTVRKIDIPLASTFTTINQFEAGKAYKFILTVKTSKITFNVEVSEWQDANSDGYDYAI